MYIAPSSDHSLLTLNHPFKVILQKIEAGPDIWSENYALFKNSFKSTNTKPTMALKVKPWAFK